MAAKKMSDGRRHASGRRRAPVSEDERKPDDGAAPGARRLLAWGLSLAAVLLAAILVVVDPFDWQLLPGLSGDDVSALEAIPPGSAFYVGADLTDTNLELLRQFQETISGSAEADVDDLRRPLDEILSQEAGVSFKEDVAPWLGQDFAFAVVSLQIDEFDQTREYEWVLVIETKDTKAGDRFLEKLALGWETRSGEPATTESSEGVALTRFEQLAFARSGRLMLFASSGETLIQSLEAQQGQSLASVPGFAEAMAQLPPERLLSAYIDGPLLNRLLASIPTPLPHVSAGNLPTAGIDSVAVGFSLVDESMQIDAAVLHGPAKFAPMPETRPAEPETAALFPEETALYLAGRGLDKVWAALRTALIAEIGPADFDESMRLFARQYSINPDEELFPYLDGEVALGLMPGSAGALAMLSDLDAEAIFLVGAGDQETLAVNLASFSKKISNPREGLGLATRHKQEPGLTVYEFQARLIPEPFLAYGLGQNYFFVGSSLKRLASLQFDGGPSLADQAAFQEAWQALPEDMSLGLYVDVPLVMEMLPPAVRDENAWPAAMLQPISVLVAGRAAGEDVTRYRVIIFTETP